MGIGRKENPRLGRVRKRYGPLVDKLIAKRRFRIEDIPAGQRAAVKALMSPGNGALVYEFAGRLHAKSTVGETVRLRYVESDPKCVALAKLIQEECWRLGCHALMSPASDRASRAYYSVSPPSALAELPPILRAQAENTDVSVFVGGDEDPDWSRGLEQKVRLSSPSSLVIHGIMDRRKVRWCIAGYPTRMKPGAYRVPRARYERVFLDSIRGTFLPETGRLCRYYKKSLEGADKVRITARDGTDLSFSIKGRPVLSSDGIVDRADVLRGDVGNNIPDGEVFLAPLERSANGRILFDFVSVDGFGLVRNLWLSFDRGKAGVISAYGDGAARFKKFLGANTGAKDRIAELGIGTNTKAQFIGNTLIDEKIFGSIHVAIGANTGAFHGRNRASSHQDMIKLMRGRGGDVYADGRAIMLDGMPAGRD